MEDLQSLSHDLARLEADPESSDIVFITGREEAKHKCHVAIFSVRCKHFLEVVSNNSQPASDGKPVVKNTDINSNTFNCFKHYVYSGKLNLEAVNMFEVLLLGETYGVSSLESIIVNYLNNNLTLSSVSDFMNQSASAYISDKSEAVKLIHRFFKENICSLRDRRLTKTLSKEAIISLVKGNLLDLEANETWRFCVEWARWNTGIQDSLSPKLWSEEQRNQVRYTMDGVVQCINILAIDSSVFAEEVEPTGAIPIELSLERYRQAALPEKFQVKPKPSSNGDFQAYPNGRSDLMPAAQVSSATRVESARALPLPRPKPGEPPRHGDLSRLNPRAETDSRSMFPRSPGTRLIHGSGILASLGTENNLSYYEHILNSWTSTPNQAWTVIFRGSDHNFSAQAFHRMCDGASPSYILVKADTGCVGGGYTDIPWSRPQGKGKYFPSEKSFLFALYNGDKPPTKFDIKKKLFAVSHHPECGPVFGAGADLFICDSCDQLADSYSNLPHSYDGQGAGPESLLGDYSFTVEEYEVLVPVVNFKQS